MKILVVDDEELLVKGIRFNLQNDGYQVVTGSNGREAIELARDPDIRLIVLDVMMPEVDGLTACRTIREFSDVPIIMLTARTEAEAITERAVKNAQTRSDAMLASAQSEAAAMREKASRDIELERRKAMNEMKREISGLAVEIASKVAEREIDEKQHEALIERFIDELGEES